MQRNREGVTICLLCIYAAHPMSKNIGTTQTFKTAFSKVIFETPDFAIFATMEGPSAKGALNGASAKSLLDVPIVLTGSWGEYKSRGAIISQKQFSFTSYEVEESEAVFFLHRVMGLALKVAEAAHAKFGARLGEVIEQKPEQLETIPGVKKKIAAKIVARWPQFAKIRILTALLGPFGVTNLMVAKIQEHFGDRATEVIRDNPYRLTEIAGIGFVKADEIALASGIDPSDPKRIQACVRYCVDQITRNDGHSAVRRGELIKVTTEELRTAETMNMGEKVASAVEALIAEDELVVIDAFHVAPGYLAHFERLILEGCQRELPPLPLLHSDIDTYIESYESRIHRTLGERQKAAIRLANTQPPIMAISGFAGTGKTTSSQASLDLYAATYGHDMIACCALSGIAANRIGSTTGYQSSTIHSLLKYTAQGWTYNRDNKLPYRVIVLDEASMTPSELLYRLLEAIDFEHGARLILLGDPAQLRPVGSGSPFADILKHCLVPHVQLDRIYRNRDGQVITMFAAEVRQGQVPNGYLEDVFDDFRFINCGRKNYWQLRKTCSTDEMRDLRLAINLDIQRKILAEVSRAADSYREAIEAGLWMHAITGCQVLSPMKEGPAGAIELNQKLQDLFNPRRPGGGELRINAQTSLRTGDRVVHLKNMNMVAMPATQYEPPAPGATSESHQFDGFEDDKVRIMNGQVGIVMFAGEIDEAPELHVRYPIEGIVVRYQQADLARYCVALAYVLTVHKSQGSEYSKVILVSSMSHYRMLDPQMIYTGMTRARDDLKIVGEDYAFSAGCRKVVDTQRLTCLDLWCSEPEPEFDGPFEAVDGLPQSARSMQLSF